MLFFNPLAGVVCLTTVLQDYRLAAVLLLLLATLITVPYIARISPSSRQHWTWVLVALVFLFWMLAGVELLRADGGRRTAARESLSIEPERLKSLAPHAQGRHYDSMKSAVALDIEVLRLLVSTLSGSGETPPNEEAVSAVRIYVYLTNPLVTPTVVEEIEQSTAPGLSAWKGYNFEEVAGQDDFYRGCVKGMAERYLDYHPDPRDCRVVAEAECAKVKALLSLNAELVRGLSGRSEAINVLSPSKYWRAARVPHGAHPRLPVAEASPLATADWWRW